MKPHFQIVFIFHKYYVFVKDKLKISSKSKPQVRNLGILDLGFFPLNIVMINVGSTPETGKKKK